MITIQSYRLGIITDVHADVHRLEAALRHMRRLGCEAIVCCGDLVDLGLFPEETIEVLRRDGIPCVRGNHDRWALGQGAAHDPRSAGPQEHDASGFDLSRAALSFLGALPTVWRTVVHGVRVVVWHSRPGDDAGMLGIYPDQLDAEAAATFLAEASADVLVVGHTHVTFEARLADGRRILNPGALWRDPEADTAPRALILGGRGAHETGRTDGGRFGVLDLPSLEFTVHDAVTGAAVAHPVVEIGPALDPEGRRQLRVYVDDERVAPDGWIRVRWPEDAIALLETNLVTEISLDHDLGDDARGTGYDVLTWVEQAVATRAFQPPTIRIHTANAAARVRMEAAVRAIQRLASAGRS